MMRLLFVLTVMFLFVCGCAHQEISRESMRLAERNISYSALRENPENFIGKYVHVGGAIAKIRNTSQGGELEVVQLRLDSSGKPENTVNSEGRFLAQGNKFLDPLIFSPGQLVSMVGEVKGKKTVPLEGFDYTYPVLAIKELHLWKPEEYPTSPRFHFGFGVIQSF